jgi:hypothetical protein
VKLSRTNLQSLTSTRGTSARGANAAHYVTVLRTAVTVIAAVAAVAALLLHLGLAKIQKITVSRLKPPLMAAAPCLQLLELPLLGSLLRAISYPLGNVPRPWLFYSYWTSKAVLPPAST